MAMGAAFILVDMDIYGFDQQYRDRGFGLVAGVDEAGRGPMAGPVVAAAVILPPELRLEWLNDSKQVTAPRRKKLFYEIMASAVAVGLGQADAAEIDEHNILEATRLAMMRATAELTPPPEFVVLDAVSLKGLKTPQEPVIKGDSKSASVAAASIIAKYSRDRMMLYYDELYPEYGFSKHKGYGTRAHMEALRKYGPCPIHRSTFKGVGEPTLF